MKTKLLSALLTFALGVGLVNAVYYGFSEVRTVYVDRAVYVEHRVYEGPLVIPEGAQYIHISNSTFGGGIQLRGTNNEVHIMNNLFRAPCGQPAMSLGDARNTSVSNNSINMMGCD